MKPLVVVNFKTYRQGKEAINLAKQIERVDEDVFSKIE